MGLRLHSICLGLAVVVLPAGVMASGLDGDLVGVVAAAVVIGVLLVILIGFMAYWCFRRMETQRTSRVPRKDSTTILTVTPRWQPNTHPTFPVFNVAESMSYSQPYYYLGDYRPKYVGVEPLQYVQPYMLEGQGHRHAQSHHHEEDEEQELENTTVAHKMDGPSQPNGHVVHDFSASSLNYRDHRSRRKSSNKNKKEKMTKDISFKKGGSFKQDSFKKHSSFKKNSSLRKDSSFTRDNSSKKDGSFKKDNSFRKDISFKKESSFEEDGSCKSKNSDKKKGIEDTSTEEGNQALESESLVLEENPENIPENHEADNTNTFYILDEAITGSDAVEQSHHSGTGSSSN